MEKFYIIKINFPTNEYIESMKYKPKSHRVYFFVKIDKINSKLI